jgi:hypothetical protein
VPILTYIGVVSILVSGYAQAHMQRASTDRTRPLHTQDLVRLIVTTREKFPRNAQWNGSIRRTLFRLLTPYPTRRNRRRKQL